MVVQLLLLFSICCWSIPLMLCRFVFLCLCFFLFYEGKDRSEKSSKEREILNLAKKDVQSFLCSNPTITVTEQSSL